MGHGLGTTNAERRELTAPAPGRVDAVLAAAWEDLTRAQVQRLIAAGAVVVNGVPVRKSAAVEAGDHVVAIIPRSLPGPGVGPETLPVLYEDDAIVFVDKPAGLPVHGGPAERGPTVAGWFVARYPGAAGGFAVDRPGIVHRLDKDTTGALALAKTPAAQAALSRAFESRRAQKTYVAICDGLPQLPRGVIDAAVGRHPGDRTKMAVVHRGRGARTVYEVVATGDGRALVEARPETGRTHQIRVHLAAIGIPVHGDHAYGRGSEGRQLLHAWRLRLPHPAGGVIEVTAPLPHDMRAAAGSFGFEAEAVQYCETVQAARLDDPDEESSPS